MKVTLGQYLVVVDLKEMSFASLDSHAALQSQKAVYACNFTSRQILRFGFAKQSS